MKRVLILNAVNTRIGGVLIRGKSGQTAHRPRSRPLQLYGAVAGCRSRRKKSDIT